jgi:phosphohistidine phosphatase SixA
MEILSAPRTMGTDSMRSARPASAGVGRRALLVAGALAPLAVGADETVATLLRDGGVVVAFRHALAPGTFDPPEFRLGDCSTQRNLNDEGRAQARRIGAWFKARSLEPMRVRSSPWCRCMDTAQLAFGATQAWPALGSPRGASEATNRQSLAELHRAIVEATARHGRFEVWVTHMFVLSDLVGTGTASGEGLVLRAKAAGAPEVVARLAAL